MSPKPTAVLVVVLFVASGCLGAPGAAGGTGTTAPHTTSPAAGSPGGSSIGTGTVVPDDCTPSRPEGVAPVRDDVSTAEYPGPPAELTAGSVRAWAVAFEEAYLRNEQLSRGTISFGASATVRNVTRVGDGYRVRVRSRWYASSGAVATGTASPTVVHADSPYYLTSYLVTERGARRASETGYDGPYPDPSSGAVVACFGGN